MKRSTSVPSLIIHNCKVFQPISGELYGHTALAVEGDRIAAIGSDSEILPLANNATRKIDGQKRWLLPAFSDGHSHLSAYAERKLKIDLSQCSSLEEALHKIREGVRKTPPGAWVIGDGWDKNRWGLPDFPDKKALDEISARHLIALQSKDWHTPDP